MATAKKSNPAPADPKSVAAAPAQSGWWVALHFLGIIAAGVGIYFLVQQARKYVETDVSPPGGAIHVVLLHRPGWMTDSLASEIAAVVPRTDHGIFDPNLLPTTVNKLKSCPWVRNVNSVRRSYGTEPGNMLLVDCDYRVPIAVVEWKNSYWLIDNDGTKLSEEFSAAQLPNLVNGPDGSVNIRIIRGVEKAPPTAGRQWMGNDLIAGLDLVKLFYGKNYLNDVDTIDVSNFGGRLDRGSPQLTLQTKFGTSIWWGRPVNAKDYFKEIPTLRKLQTLKLAVAKLGRIDAGRSYFDIRYEYSLVPATEPSGDSDGTEATTELK
jgi:hypothetical protein